MKQKRFDYCTVIGRNPQIYQKHVDNVLRNSGLDRSEWEFHTICYRNSRIPSSITNEIAKIADENGITLHMYDEIEGTDYETFLHNLYACWDLCQRVGNTPLNMRAGSDQAFSKNSFKNTIAAWDYCVEQMGHENFILFHNLVECAANTDTSRHILANFGRNWHEFDENSFQEWCKKNEESGLFDWKRANEKWGAPRDLPGLISNGRADGASWLQSKDAHIRFGPMLPRMEYGTGDITMIERYRNAGFGIFIVGNATTYHIVRGESSGR